MIDNICHGRDPTVLSPGPPAREAFSGSTGGPFGNSALAHPSRERPDDRAVPGTTIPSITNHFLYWMAQIHLSKWRSEDAADGEKTETYIHTLYY